MSLILRFIGHTLYWSAYISNPTTRKPNKVKHFYTEEYNASPVNPCEKHLAQPPPLSNETDLIGAII
jgi:hypothetical protein